MPRQPPSGPAGRQDFADDRGVEVAAIDTLSSTPAVPNAELHEVAARVGAGLRDAVHAL